MRQLRLRDIGGIIVIDFIDMANPKNRQAVEDALRNELERDRTKTYVVEISPLGLVEMTRQNVTEGPREILTRKCPTCGGDGVVISEQTAAIDVERRLRALAHGSRVAGVPHRGERRESRHGSIGPGAARLQEIEAPREAALLPRAEGGRPSRPLPRAPAGQARDAGARGAVRGGRDARPPARRGRAARSRSRGRRSSTATTSCVADGAKLVGKKVKVQIERVLPGTAYATVVEEAEGRRRADHRRGRGREADAQAGRARRPTPTGCRRAGRREGGRGDAARSRSPRRGRRRSRPRRPRRGDRRGRDGRDAARRRRRGAAPAAAARHKKTPTIHVPEAGANGAERRTAQPEPEAAERRAARRGAEPVAQPEPVAEPEAVARAGERRRGERRSRRGRRRRRGAEEEDDAPWLARRPEPAQEAGRRRLRPNPATAARIADSRGRGPAFRPSWLK